MELPFAVSSSKTDDGSLGSVPMSYDNVHPTYFVHNSNNNSTTANHPPSSCNTSTSTGTNMPIMMHQEEEDDEDDELYVIEESFVTVGDDEDDDDHHPVYYNHHYSTNHNHHTNQSSSLVRVPTTQQHVSYLFTMLLSNHDDGGDDEEEDIWSLCQVAQECVRKAQESNNVVTMISNLTQVSKYYKQIATILLGKKYNNTSLALTFLVQSKSHAQRASSLQQHLLSSSDPSHKPTIHNSTENSSSSSSLSSSIITTKNEEDAKNDLNTKNNRLRAKIRSSMDHKSNVEADITDSIFLDKTKTTTTTNTSTPVVAVVNKKDVKNNNIIKKNPVDEMMKLERELRDLDMSLLNQKNTTTQDSFCVVPPNAILSSSNLWTSALGSRTPTPTKITNTTLTNNNNISNANNHNNTTAISNPIIAPNTNSNNNMNTTCGGLDSSWWGHGSTMNVASSANSVILNNNNANNQNTASVNKQLMRLLDSLKTLGDENASLLKEVEEARIIHSEAKQIQTQMKVFKQEYGKRFATLKTALQKFQTQYNNNNSTTASNNNNNNTLINPVSTR